jgi:hypothetical protein
MKTSNKLLLGLFILVLFSALAANIPMKRAFETMDRNDPYYGYRRDTLTAFKYVKLTGNGFTLVQIQPGSQFEMRSMHFERNPVMGHLRKEVRGDTLFVVMKKEKDSETYPWSPNPMEEKPAVYIMAPTLSGVSTEGLFTKITGWRSKTLAIAQAGKILLLADNHLDSLSIAAYWGSSVEIEATNGLDSATLLVRDSSRVSIQKNVFKTFRMQVDSNAHVSLPGSMLRGREDL